MVYTVKLLKKEQVASGTMAFHFEKPAGFEFKPGQNCDWTLVNPPEIDAEGTTRTFSIVSAPFEPDIVITTRMRDTAFKRVLGNLPLGAEISMKGPAGSFTLHNDTEKPASATSESAPAGRPAVFLAGGIGVTPFMSIIRDSRRTPNPVPITLFYSNRRVEDAPFLTELEEYHSEDTLTRQSAEGGGFRLVATMTEPNLSKDIWEEETGYIDAPMIARYLEDTASPVYYVAGPPEMVAAMQKMLESAEISPDNIRTEDFSGY